MVVNSEEETIVTLLCLCVSELVFAFSFLGSEMSFIFRRLFSKSLFVSATFGPLNVK